MLLNLLDDAPIGLIDIGARGGVPPMFEPMARAIAVLGFEPEPEEAARLNAEAKNTPAYAFQSFEPTGLHNRTGTASLHIAQVPTNSSLFEPNEHFIARYAMEKWVKIDETAVPVTTLDKVLFETRHSETTWGEVIKVDTQGSEYEILSGARRTLEERTRVVVAEVSFCELYKGQKLFSDVELLLREHGFSFYGFSRLYNRSRKSLDKASYTGRERPIQADAIFYKDPFDPHTNTKRTAVSRRDLTIAASMALATGYHDFALELAEAIDGGAPALRDYVRSAAQIPDGRAIDVITSLYEAAKNNPSHAAILLGKVVDQYRDTNDFFDVSAPDGGAL